MRKLISALVVALAAAAATVPASAQTFPSRPITMIVPFSAGGPTDVTARIVAEHMSRTLGQQIIIENVVGAGGTTGSVRTMRATPDGYTIEMGQLGTHAASVAVYPNLPYRPDADFAPIGLVVDQAVLIIARKDFPADDLKGFLAQLKTNSDKLNMAHAGIGSITHFSCLLLNAIVGAKPTLVPFNGSAPAINALVGSQVDYMCDPISDIVQQIQAGTLKVYATGTAKRSAALPTIPTTAEAGLPEFAVSAWYGLFAPKATPQPVLDTLTAALDKALDDDTVRRRLSDLGCDIPDKGKRGQAELGKLVKGEIARWTPVIRAATTRE
jgi:tripartite-type tricarboxylate transporter receptor subunit TctC